MRFDYLFNQRFSRLDTPGRVFTSGLHVMASSRDAAVASFKAQNAHLNVLEFAIVAIYHETTVVWSASDAEWQRWRHLTDPKQFTTQFDQPVPRVINDECPECSNIGQGPLCKAHREPQERERGDDDGREYSDPRDEQEERRWS